MRRHMRFNSPQHRAHRALFGLSVVGIGFLALADNLHWFGLPMLHTFWPLVLVAMGMGRLIWPKHRGSWVFGLTLMVAGVLITANNLGRIEVDLHQWWPLLVIMAGVSMALRGLFPHHQPNTCRSSYLDSGVEHGDTVNIDGSFSGVKMQNDSREFKGGRIESTFGGVELDLTQAAMVGPEAVLDVKLTFGALELKVPRGWQVVVHMRSTMAAIEDKTAPPLPPCPRLILRGTLSFGGIEIKH